MFAIVWLTLINFVRLHQSPINLYNGRMIIKNMLNIKIHGLEISSLHKMFNFYPTHVALRSVRIVQNFLRCLRAVLVFL